jgi:hypothetical protein
MHQGSGGGSLWNAGISFQSSSLTDITLHRLKDTYMTISKWLPIAAIKPPPDTVVAAMYDDGAIGTGSFPKDFDWVTWRDKYKEDTEGSYTRIVFWCLLPDAPDGFNPR